MMHYVSPLRNTSFYYQSLIVNVNSIFINILQNFCEQCYGSVGMRIRILLFISEF